MISFLVRLTPQQHRYLAKVKKDHGISMSGQIRNLIKLDMYGIGGRSEIRRTGPKRSRPVQAGPSGYSSCVRELQKVFEKRKEAVG